MQSNDLGYYLSARKKDLIKELDHMCDLTNDESWIVLPNDPTNKICLVAHIDTVHDDERKKLVCYDPNNKLYWSPDGLGADDRAGVYAILKVWNSLPENKKPVLLFTDMEELGGLGAYSCEDWLHVLNDCSYFIELDRQGKNEMVFYNQEQNKFVEKIGGHGFKEAKGTFSDISILGDLFNLCAVNLSIGFYNEHTKGEFLNERYLNKTIKKVIQICLEHDGIKWELPENRYIWGDFKDDNYKFDIYESDYGLDQQVKYLKGGVK